MAINLIIIPNQQTGYTLDFRKIFNRAESILFIKMLGAGRVLSRMIIRSMKYDHIHLRVTYI